MQLLLFFKKFAYFYFSLVQIGDVHHSDVTITSVRKFKDIVNVLIVLIIELFNLKS